MVIATMILIYICITFLIFAFVTSVAFINLTTGRLPHKISCSVITGACNLLALDTAIDR